MRSSSRVGRSAMTAAGGVLLALALTGCGAIDGFLHEQFPDQFGPQRGADGRVSAEVAAHAYYLEVGDCFSFPNANDRNEVAIVPCRLDHPLEVIAKGELTVQELRSQGAQLAASAKCAEPFAAFKAAAPEGSHPDQEFVITERKDGERTITNYACAASLTGLTGGA